MLLCNNVITEITCIIVPLNKADVKWGNAAQGLYKKTQTQNKGTGNMPDTLIVFNQSYGLAHYSNNFVNAAVKVRNDISFDSLAVNCD